MGGILEIYLCCEQLSKIQSIYLQAKHILYIIIMPYTYYLLHKPSNILCLQNISNQVSFLSVYNLKTNVFKLRLSVLPKLVPSVFQGQADNIINNAILCITYTHSLLFNGWRMYNYLQMWILLALIATYLCTQNVTSLDCPI
jgi:hypothetical protein